MLNWFTLAGEDSRDYGVYLTGAQTYGSPEKAYETYDVPGRNGLLLGSNRKLLNAEYIYTCTVFGEREEVEENLARFRTFLLSLEGYQRLEDTYHPDEYRMAVCMGPIEPEVSEPLDAADLEIVFQCLPQRFLKSGDTEYSPFSGAITGNPVYANMADIDTSTLEIYVDKPLASGDFSYARPFAYDPVKVFRIFADGERIWSKTLSDRVMQGTITPSSGATVTRALYDLPSTGWAKAEGYGTVFYVPQPVLGGTIIDCNIWKMTAASAIHTVGSCWLENGNFYAAFPGNVTTVEQAEAFVAQFKPTVVQSGSRVYRWSETIELPAHWGEVSANVGEITVEVTGSDTLTNPTRFASKPLIRAYGTGVIRVNGITITISACDSYVDIDCDMMDCYEGSTNRNKDVTFSSYDFPTLAPGDNTFEIVSGVTALRVTPRWWRV